jgi:hypothetical protein
MLGVMVVTPPRRPSRLSTTSLSAPCDRLGGRRIGGLWTFDSSQRTVAPPPQASHMTVSVGRSIRAIGENRPGSYGI